VSEKTTRADLSRRRFLGAATSGGAGLAAWSLLGGQASAAATASGRQAQAGGGGAAVITSLNGGWLFGGAWVAGSDQPGYDDSGFAAVTLPHVQVPLSWNEWDPTTWEQVWIYRRHFSMPSQAASGMRTFADFQGALTTATPTINGTQLAAHQGGYLPFSYELTGYLRPQANVLAVKLDSTWQNVPPEGSPDGPVSVDYSEAGGLYRDVALRFVPQVFLADVFALPTDVLSTAPQVQVQATVDAAVVPGSPVTVTAELLDGGKRLARESAPVQITAPGQVTASVTLSGFGAPRLWDNDHPSLYEVVVTVSIGGHPVHDFTRRIGFREALFQDDGFFLNGSRLKLFGLDRHQMFPYHGMAMPDRAQRRDAEILKKLNCNMVRMSHYPQDPAFLDACDELGIMLWEETPGWGYLGDAAWQAIMLQNVSDMVTRDRSRPSVIIWGVKPNEAPNDPTLYTQSKELADSLDGSRPTSGTTYHSLTDFVFDVMAFDYSTTSAGASLAAPVPGIPYLVTEAVGTLSGPAPYYRWFDTQAVQQGQAVAHARVHNIAGSQDAYCGLLAWCGIDYDAITPNTYQDLKWCGVVDTFRLPKPGAAFYLAQGDPAGGPVIEPSFYWDFGTTSPVTTLGTQAMVWSNCDTLQAYIGGQYVATLTPDTTDYPYLAHAPFYLNVSAVDGSSLPELRLDGYVGSAKVASRTFASDPSGDRLVLLADETEIAADGADTARVAFRVVDRYGNPRPYPTGNVTVELDGAATWVGEVLTFDSASNLGVLQPGQQATVTATLANGTFPFEANGGVGGIHVRALPGRPGTITVRVTHPTYGTASTRITAKPAPEPFPGSTVSSRQKVNPRQAMTYTDVALALALPDGWTATATTPTTVAELAPGASASAEWTVTPAANANGVGTVTATASFIVDQGQASQSSVLTIVPAAAATTLADAFNNAGISDDSDVTSADMDGAGNSYSAEALAAAGFTPGVTFTYDGVTFTWPDVASGQPDNVLAEGQVILVSGSGTRLAFVGSTTPSSDAGLENGTGTVLYSDGTSSSYALTLDNYFDPPSTVGNETVVETPYVNCSNPAKNNGVIGQRDHAAWVFYTTVPIDPGKTVQAVLLPDTGSATSDLILGMHIFAIAVGS
jgi:beta-galactosidase